MTALTAAAIRLMADKGLSALDIADIAEACVSQRSSGATRQKRYRDNKRNALRNESDVTGDVTEENPFPPNDIYSNPPENPVGAKAPTSPFAEKVVEAWNAGPAARGATKAQKLDAGRRKHLAARVREHGEDAVFQAIRGIECSDFHCGIGAKSYRTNLGWLLKSPEHFVAAMERAGNAAPAASTAPVSTEDHAAFIERMRAMPWMRGRENEIDVPRPPANGHAPPRSLAQVTGGIVAGMTVQ